MNKHILDTSLHLFQVLKTLDFLKKILLPTTPCIGNKYNVILDPLSVLAEGFLFNQLLNALITLKQEIDSRGKLTPKHFVLL